MVNVLLGMLRAEAAMANVVKPGDDARHVAWEEQFKAAGEGLEDLVRRVEFIRWQVLPAGTPLLLMAQKEGAGPILLAAAHAATRLHLLLG
ncbi:hypothetical protein SUDANB21_05333 [Streptomyces sp. enrichment culture]